jgi:hypothetical protein
MGLKLAPENSVVEECGSSITPNMVKLYPLITP